MQAVPRSRLSRWRTILLTMLALVASITAVIVGTAAPAMATGTYATSAIADEAERFADGTVKGECKAFVGNVVQAVSGTYPSGYQEGFHSAGATEITDPAAAVRGDIIQITPAGSNDNTPGSTPEDLYLQSVPSRRLHTAIIRGPRNADNTFNVIDSNWGNDLKVQRHPLNPNAYAPGSIIKIWRFGIAGTQNGRIIESGGNLYVAAGNRAFWFNRNNSTQLNAYKAQSQTMTGTQDYKAMDPSELHAIEVNRDNNGAYSPGNHMPSDNTFLYEYGSTTQYVIKYQRPFAIGSGQEAIDLGGLNKAVMVPVSISDLQQHAVQWVQDDLNRFWGNTAVWHFSGVGYRVGSTQVQDCLLARGHRVVTLMPISAWNFFPTNPTQLAGCDFSHGQWLYGSPSNQQIQVLYGTGFSVGYGEVAPLGGTDQAFGISDTTVNWLLTRPLAIPNHHLFQAANSPAVFLVEGQTFRPVPNPSTRDCLMAQYGVGVELVPQSLVSSMSQGVSVNCAYEGKQIILPSGAVSYIKDGQRRPVPNPTVRDCLIGRAGTGSPIAVAQSVWDSYPAGASAFCPYNRGANFIQENNNPTVWLVDPISGVKRHAGSLCVPDPYTTQLVEFHVWVVPANETAGYSIGPDWFASGSICADLPRP